MAKQRGKNLLILLLLLATTTFYAQEQRVINSITLEQLKKNVIGKEVQLIDVRTPKEYQAGHIEDAINIDIYNKQTFVTQVLKLNKDAPVYLYCYLGVRSKRASNLLKDLGFKHVYDFSGGWKAWKKKEIHP